MSIDVLLALSLFAFVSSITPGPNNLMLMTSGMNFGFRRTLPHLVGVSGGFALLVLLVGLGLASLFQAVPAAHTVLRVLSIGYLLFLAAKIALTTPAPLSATSSSSTSDAAKPMGFFGAAAFQWVNPKAWTMAMTAVTTYVPQEHASTLVVVAVVFGVINLPCCAVWALAGVHLRRWLSVPKRQRVFNVVAAVLLVASVLPML